MLKTLLTALVLSAPVCTVAVRPCSNGALIPQEVRVVACMVEPCIVQIGGVVDMDLDFIVPRASNGMRATLDIFLGVFCVPY